LHDHGPDIRSCYKDVGLCVIQMEAKTQYQFQFASNHTAHVFGKSHQPVIDPAVVSFQYSSLFIQSSIG